MTRPTRKPFFSMWGSIIALIISIAVEDHYSHVHHENGGTPPGGAGVLIWNWFLVAWFVVSIVTYIAVSIRSRP